MGDYGFEGAGDFADTDYPDVKDRCISCGIEMITTKRIDGHILCEDCIKMYQNGMLPWLK